jgi:hypothetical protein
MLLSVLHQAALSGRSHLLARFSAAPACFRASAKHVGLSALVLFGQPIAFICAAAADFRAHVANVELATAGHQLSIREADVGAVAAKNDALGHAGHLHAHAFTEAVFAFLRALEAELDTFFHCRTRALT